jgi:hypothetical protein
LCPLYAEGKRRSDFKDNSILDVGASLACKFRN